MKNEEACQFIINSFNEKKNSHAFLIETNNVDRALISIKNIIKIINCPNGGVDCDCNICHMIETDNCPDLETIKPDGKEIKKDQVIDVIKKFNTKSLVCKYSSYIIYKADKLNDSSANKLLKFLEEPEGQIVGFYITDNILSILPTIRSRCELYTLNYSKESILDILEITEDEYSKYFNYTLTLLEKLNNSPKYILMNESKELSKKERFELEIVLNLLNRFYILKYNIQFRKVVYENDMVTNITNIIIENDINNIVKRIKILDNILTEFKINVNKELIFNKLFLMWE